MTSIYPKKNSKVFISGNNYMAHIPKSIDNTYDELLDRYYNGFKELADAGVRHLIHHHYSNREKDRLIFPIIYNYRHFLELILKKYAIKYKRDELNLKKLDHNLETYWGKVKPLLLETYSHQENVEEVVSAAENYIMEFHELDKSSMSFRYPFAKGESLTPCFEDELRIDFVNLQQRMEELYNLLEYLEDSLNAKRM